MSKCTKTKLGFLAFSFVVILISDQVSKMLIHERFHWGESLVLIPNFFSLTYVRNQGAAFGFMHKAPEWFRDPFFLIMPLVVMVFIAVLFARVTAEMARWRLWVSGYCLILSGAVGNLIDRLRFGYVIDFIDLHWKEYYHYPAFNVADSAIVIGVGILLILTFLDERQRKHSVKS